jgi:transcriptional regulator with XRE-family HTH domain
MRLIEARIRRNMIQWDIRKKTGIHQSKISLIENGYIKPTEKEKMAIAQALNFGADEIEWNPEVSKS